MPERRDPTVAAVEAVYSALKDMDAADRKKVLSSALALLGLDGPATPSSSSPPPATLQHPSASSTSSTRPLSLTELIIEKKPGSNAQRIAAFAYYREKVEGTARFSRGDLKPYFSKARLAPAANYDRDFGEAVRTGWIHEDGAESYLTTKGMEIVEANFEGERKYSKGRKVAAAKKAKKRKR